MELGDLRRLDARLLEEAEAHQEVEARQQLARQRCGLQCCLSSQDMHCLQQFAFLLTVNLTQAAVYEAQVVTVAGTSSALLDCFAWRSHPIGAPLRRWISACKSIVASADMIRNVEKLKDSKGRDRFVACLVHRLLP